MKEIDDILYDCQELVDSDVNISKLSKTLSQYVIKAREEQEKKWQDMCERFVGDSMLAHEFENEPHNPISFGDYVENLNEQIATLKKGE